jgi:hypothetical protein
VNETYEYKVNMNLSGLGLQAGSWLKREKCRVQWRIFALAVLVLLGFRTKMLAHLVMSQTGIYVQAHLVRNVLFVNNYRIF